MVYKTAVGKHRNLRNADFPETGERGKSCNAESSDTAENAVDSAECVADCRVKSGKNAVYDSFEKSDYFPKYNRYICPQIREKSNNRANDVCVKPGCNSRENSADFIPRFYGPGRYAIPKAGEERGDRLDNICVKPVRNNSPYNLDGFPRATCKHSDVVKNILECLAHATPQIREPRDGRRERIDNSIPKSGEESGYWLHNVYIEPFRSRCKECADFIPLLVNQNTKVCQCAYC